MQRSIVILLCLALASAGCGGPRISPQSPYGEPEETLKNRLGFDPDTGLPATRIGTLAQLNYAAEACAEAARNTSSMSISTTATDGGTPNPNAAPTKVDIGAANCRTIYNDYFEEAASLSDLACDTFIDNLYARQQGLSGLSDVTNIAAGVMSAAVGIFSLGSMIGGITGVSVSALNLLFDSYASNYLFTIPAGDIRTLVYTQKKVVRDEIVKQAGIPTIYSAKIHIRNYFLSCTPASVQQFVTKAIQEKAAKSFLDDGLARETQTQIAVARIVEVGKEISPYLGGDGNIAVTPQGVAALFYALAPDKSKLSGDPAENRKERVAQYLLNENMLSGDNKYILNKTLRDARIQKKVAAMNTPPRQVPVTDADVAPLVDAEFKIMIEQPLFALSAGGGAAMLAALNSLLAALPPVNATPADVVEGDVPASEIPLPTPSDAPTGMNPGLLGGY